jgi:hypothetical protein
MTPEQLATLRQRLTEGRQPAGAPRMRYAHPQGWNDALDFVDRVLKEILGEKAEASS